jgi:hypothetical protein
MVITGSSGHTTFNAPVSMSTAAGTAGFFGTASWALNVVGGGGGGAAFPFTGSAAITGSLIVTGSITVRSGSSNGDVVTNLTDTYTSIGRVLQIVTLTTAEYNAIGTKDPNTLYIVT